MYRRYATPVNASTTSKLYFLQLFLIFFVAFLSCVRFASESFIFKDAEVYGYTVTEINIFLIEII